MNPRDIPTLVFFFNRPENLQVLLKRLEEFTPRYLYLVSDGPRDTEEAKLVFKCREIASLIPWECEVTRHYFDENEGIGIRARSEISEVLGAHDGVLVLEDDCIPKAGAFDYLAAAINELEGNPRVASIGTYNPIGRTPFLGHKAVSLSTTFRGWGPYIKRPHWDEYIRECRVQPIGIARCFIEATKFPGLVTKFIKLKILLHHRNEAHHADRYMNMFFRSMGYLSAVPRESMLDNIGDGESATNTSLLPDVKLHLKGDMLTRSKFDTPLRLTKRIDRIEGWLALAWVIGRILQGKRFTGR